MTCKGRLAGLLALLTLLPSCASLLERDYTVTAQHQENTVARADGAYQVETYPALCSALLSYVEEGMEEGVLRLPTTYPGNLTVDLEKARRQLLEEEPLGAYALSAVSFNTSRIISYYEVDLTFTYRPQVDRESLGTIRTVRTPEELAAALGQAAQGLETSLTLYLTQYDDQGGDPFVQALARGLADRPGAVDIPQISAVLYPASGGTRRVVQLDFTYTRALSTLERRRERLETVAEELARSAGRDPQALFEGLAARSTFDPQGGNTAFDALVMGRANSEGLARAYQLLGQLTGLTCTPAWEGETCYILLTLEDGREKCLDLTGESFALLDQFVLEPEGQEARGQETEGGDGP